MLAKISRTVGYLGCLTAISCGDSGDSAANQSVPVELAEDLTVLTQQQADQVVVQPDRLVFPSAGNQTLLSMKDRSNIASDRSGIGGSKTNAFGFLRRVAGTETQGDTIIVHTTSATLVDVIRRGESHAKVDVPWSALQGTVVKSLPYHPQDLGNNGPLVDTTPTLTLPAAKIPVVIHGKTVELSVSASIAMEQAMVDFRPSFDFGLSIDWFSVKEFHAIANGAFDAGLKMKVSASIAWDHSLTDDEPADEVMSSFADELAKLTDMSADTPLVSGSIGLPTWMIGPVPVVTDLNIDVSLECKLSMQGSIDVEVGATASSTVSAGLRYQDGKMSPVASQSFQSSLIGPNFTGAAGLGIECSLKPSLQLRFYGAIGPYLYVDFYDRLGADLKSECGSSSRPDCSATVSSTMGIRGGVGAKVDINVFGIGLKQDLGELQLFDWSVPNALINVGPTPCDLGTCQAPPPPDGGTPPPDGGTGPEGGPTPVCTAGDTRCNSGATAVETCKSDGSGWAISATCTGGSCASGACVSCSPNWQCDAWSTCSCGKHASRTCTDSHNCGTSAGKPAETKTCDPCTTVAGGAVACGASPQFPQGCSDTLYTCSSSHTTQSAVKCPNGCHQAPQGVEDYCNPNADCTSGDTQPCQVIVPDGCGAGFDSYCNGQQTCGSGGTWGSCVKYGACMC